MRVKGEEAQLLRLLISHRASQSMSIVSHCLGTSGASHTKTNQQTPRETQSRGNFALFFSGRTVVGSKKMSDGSAPEEKTTHCITAVG